MTASPEAIRRFPRWEPVLSPPERYSEILFGLIMVLSITDSMSVAGSGKKAASGAC